MIKFEIPVDEGTFVEVVKRKTQVLKDDLLHEYSIEEYAVNRPEDIEYFWKKLKTQLKPFVNKVDRTIFISELLIYIGEKREIVILEYSDNPLMHQLLDDLCHFFYRELEKINVGLDRNAFTVAEVKSITAKVNLIIKSLDKLAIGQEVIFNRVEELTQDYKDILSTFGLGKKPFYQRFSGILLPYIGEKGADEVYNRLKPLLKEVVNYAVKQITI